MPQVLARNLTEELVSALKERARNHNRSLSQEIRVILEESLSVGSEHPLEVADSIRAKLATKGIAYTDSGDAQAEDRLR